MRPILLIKLRSISKLTVKKKSPTKIPEREKFLFDMVLMRVSDKITLKEMLPTYCFSPKPCKKRKAQNGGKDGAPKAS
jgi:hypothetical protein